MRKFSLVSILLLGFSALIVPTVLLPHLSSVQAITVDLPDEFVQCEPAQINLTQTRGNVTILIRRAGTRVVNTNVTLPINATSWTWPAVDFPAGANFTILVTDLTPHKKTSDTRVLSRSTVDPSPTNNDTCLPRKNGRTGSDGDGNKPGPEDGGDIDGGFFGDHHSARHKNSTTEIAAIAGVLGGLMFVLLALTVFMCFRRRFETRGTDETDDGHRYPMAARRLRDDDGIYDPHQVVTLFGHDGQPEGQAVLGRQGDAGWTYMSRMVPGLESSSPAIVPHHFSASRRRSAGGRRRLLTAVDPTLRYDDEQKDIELPSYGMSEYERKNLPKYNENMQSNMSNDTTATGGGTSEGRTSHPVLITRRDSRGSRLTFSSHAVRASSRVQSHIVSTPRASVALYPSQRPDAQSARVRLSSGQDDHPEDVIVFGASAQTDALESDVDNVTGGLSLDAAHNADEECDWREDETDYRHVEAAEYRHQAL